MVDLDGGVGILFENLLLYYDWGGKEKIII